MFLLKGVKLLFLVLCSRSTEFVEAKIEEFLVSFGERLSGLSEEAFSTQVTALIKLKECEDAHLGEEVDRNWFEVVTQQYVFDRLNKEVRDTHTLFYLALYLSPAITMLTTKIPAGLLITKKILGNKWML